MLEGKEKISNKGLGPEPLLIAGAWADMESSRRFSWGHGGTGSKENNTI